MREVLEDLLSAYRSGDPVAMATVVRTWKSAPRPAGAAMLVTGDHEAVGSVSGGCVEGALFDVGVEILDDGLPRYEKYGVSDDEAFGVGLTCGGIIEVFVERVDQNSWPELEQVAASIDGQEPLAIATIVRAPEESTDRVGRHLVVRPDRTEGSLGTARLDDTVREDALGLLAAGTTGFLHYGPQGERLGSATA
jgi:Xanthine and CO dehydrogenases maturation factor, XdhC/CoxF family